MVLNLLVCRDRSFEQLVELGAQIGIKIRERDDNKSDPKVIQSV